MENYIFIIISNSWLDMGWNLCALIRMELELKFSNLPKVLGRGFFISISFCPYD